MKRLYSILPGCGLLLLLFTGCSPDKGSELEAGQLLRSSATFQTADYHFPGADSLDQPAITVQGEDIVLDFSGITLDGAAETDMPDQFKGLGILVKDSRNVTIKNLSVRGYKVGLMAVHVDSLKLIDCDFSYNYRPRLASKRERESLADWLSYHQNDQDEWLRYGAGIYLKDCTHPVVKGVTITQNQNALLMTGTTEGLIYNNFFSFNSGLGVGLYRSSGNRVMHNRLDWNVRGYSHEIYQRGQDSAGILCYEQSNNNTFAFNSATHSGDGFFLWPGQSTIDSGAGGCNDNLIYANNFSYAPANGIEVTFSSNKLIGNELKECRYGVWGGYSWKTLMLGNTIENCDFGIAVENGQDNTISHNNLKFDKVGIQLFERPHQPDEWGYSRVKDVSSRNYQIAGNLFFAVNNPFYISGTDHVAIADSNQVHEARALLTGREPNEDLTFNNNDFYMVYGDGNPVKLPETNRFNPPPDNPRWKALEDRFIGPAMAGLDLPKPLPDGMDASLSEDQMVGRKFILMNEWGPYNFKYPSIWLRSTERGEYTFLVLGPHGNWKAVGGQGVAGINPKTGNFPATIRVKRDPDATVIALDLEFIGDAFTDQFGKVNPKGKVFPIRFNRVETAEYWEAHFYNYDENTDPIQHYDAFKALKNQPPQAVKNLGVLTFNWANAPDSNMKSDRYGTFASTTFPIEKGNYRFTVTSDDGVRVFLDGKLILDHWSVHEAAVDIVEVPIEGGEHTLEVEHFNQDGGATLDLYIEKAG
ncbi:MAG: right-handed parallel beta-helix repeat-containing protein [Lewinellaceae bacterium]|nr:right-handed parallel beta-helix repeat-containing protein [Lewinellaceae bacterium]